MIILASASPRRIQMLKEAGLDIVVKPASIIENLPFPMSPETATMYLAMEKATAVASSRFCQLEAQKSSEPILVLGADTVVVHKGRIIGKPVDEDEAFAILKELKGISHHVITGCCIIKFAEKNPSKILSKDCFYEDTKVFFKDYSDEELLDYVRTDEPYDKAGGYAIQGGFGKYIDHFEGDYDNVVGLPLKRVLERLAAD